jgi:outer membrane scaffolding protein for murein synthesis (MipA/OmpV family)
MLSPQRNGLSPGVISSLVLALITVTVLLSCGGLVHAADLSRTATDDDDDDDDAPVTKPTPSLSAPSQSKETQRLLFSTLPAKDWHIEVGLQQRFTSRLGKRRAIEGATGLLLDITWRDTLFITAERGIGANLLTAKQLFAGNDRFVAGLSVNYDDSNSGERSRSQARAADAKRALSPFVLGFADYQIGRWKLWTEFAVYTGNAKGNVLSLGVEYRLPITAKWSTTFATGFSLADKAYVKDNYPATFLSVPGKPFTAFKPATTLRDLTVSTEFEYRADDHWRWNTVVGFTNSLALAAPGVVIKARSTPFVGTAIRYRF